MSKPAYSPTRVENIRALRDHVIVTDMQFKGRQLSSGIILPSDNGKAAGIRPRWGLVYRVGPEQHDVRPGQWICVAHGRWTRGLEIEDDVDSLLFTQYLFQSSTKIIDLMLRLFDF